MRRRCYEAKRNENWPRIEHGDSEAHDHLIRANLRLVVNIARKYVGRGPGLEDLIAEGNLGLMRAVEGFDPAMNTRFSTYASYWIKQSIRRYLIGTAKTVRLPAYMVDLMAKWRAPQPSCKRSWDGATKVEIVDRLQLPRKKLNIIKKALRIHNGGIQGEQKDDYSIDEALEDMRNKAPDAALGERDELHQVLQAGGAPGAARRLGHPHAFRPGRRGTADAEGNRRSPRSDARTRAANRARRPRSARRLPRRELNARAPRTLVQ